MGTRNLTVVVYNKEVKIAQYGQWDGFRDGQGKIALDFCKSMDLEVFKSQLDKCKFMGEVENKEVSDYIESIGSTDGWVNMEQSALIDAKYPILSRNVASEVLEYVNNSPENVILLRNDINFAKDSLFCEFVSVIDLDVLLPQIRIRSCLFYCCLFS